MGIVTRAGDWSFKAFTAGLGLATIYLTGTFSFNVYRGLSWHNAQSVCFFSLFLSNGLSLVNYQFRFLLDDPNICRKLL